VFIICVALALQEFLVVQRMTGVERAALRGAAVGRGLHSSTLPLNLSAFCVTGGAVRGCFGGVWRW
jgi:hypothetical protein